MSYVWFRKEDYPNTTMRRALNGAARMAKDRFGPLSRLQLMCIRMEYSEHRNAAEIFEAAARNREFPQ